MPLHQIWPGDHSCRHCWEPLSKRESLACHQAQSDWEPPARQTLWLHQGQSWLSHQLRRAGEPWAFPRRNPEPAHLIGTQPGEDRRLGCGHDQHLKVSPWALGLGSCAQCLPGRPEFRGTFTDPKILTFPCARTDVGVGGDSGQQGGGTGVRLASPSDTRGRGKAKLSGVQRPCLASLPHAQREDSRGARALPGLSLQV